MANQLKMAIVQTILRLHALGWSQRRIARELAMDRETVRRYVACGETAAKPAISPAGSVGAGTAKPAVALVGPGTEQAAGGPAAEDTAGGLGAEDAAGGSALPGTPSAASCRVRGRTSHCEPFRAIILQKLAQQLSAQRIFQDLSSAHGFAGGYDSVKRFVRRLGHVAVLPVRRMECAAVIDNLKAAVAHADWFDPELTAKLQSFCQHYGTVILPTKPRTPRHKGKIERGIGYVKGNALKARQFTSLEAENRHLAEWEATVADTRIHGTTRKQVGKLFAEVERAALLPLPRERFAMFHEAERKVSRDGHVEVAKAFYSVPPEYLGRTVWARWDARLVRVFNHRFQPIAVHVRQEPGRFSTHAAHVAPEKISGLERGAEYLLGKLEPIGPHTRQWAEAMLVARGIEGTRVLLGLVSLSKRHAGDALEKACEIALSHGAFRLRTLRKLVARHAAAAQLPLDFLDEHPIIRPLDDYARVVAAALQRTARRQERDWNKDEETKGGVFAGMAEQKNVAASPHHKTAPMVETTGATAEILPPRSGYPSSGCSPAEPDSVSPDHCSEARDVLLLGPPGVGKSFLVQAVGYQAIKQGFVVLYRSIFDVVRDLLHDEAFAAEEKVLAKYLKPDLLIVDDMGMKQLPKRSGEYLFEIIMRRYETRSTVMTSNRPIEDWGKLIGDVPSATAILHRFLHHAEIVTLAGKSYRLRNRAAVTEKIHASAADSAREPTDPPPAISPAGSEPHSNTNRSKNRLARTAADTPTPCNT